MAEEMNTSEMEVREDGEIGDMMDPDDMDNRGGSDEEDGGEQHEFEIIDQVESDEDEDGKRAKDGNDLGDGKDDSSDTDFDDSQLHEMLEKGIDKETITPKKPDEPTEDQPIIRHKVILQEVDDDPFDILPEGWVCAFHNSGMPVYLHKESRVCTMARPYYLGSASTRKHDIPISAIPCLQYQRKLEAKQNEEIKTDEPSTTVANETAAIETAIQAPPPNADENCTSAENIPSTQQQTTCPYQQEQAQQQTSQPENTEGLPPADAESSPNKMWMVTQDSSGKSPSQREPEELHTGKTNDFTNEISQVDPDSQLTTSHSNTNKATDNSPHSPGEENIAVKYDSSTPLKFEAYDGGYYSVGDVKTSLCFQENDSRDKDISIRKDSQEKDPTDFHCKVPKVESNVNDAKNVIVESDVNEAKNVMNGDIVVDQQQAVITACVNNTSDSGTDGQPAVPDSSQNNIVVEETSANVDSSELVTSNTSRISIIKRRIEDLKRKGAKQRKLMDGTAEEVAAPTPPAENTAASENNIAVDIFVNDAKLSEERLRLHGATVKVLSAEDRAKNSVLDIDTVHKYCAKLFVFKTIVVKKYRTWRERRKHLLAKHRPARPELPSDTKLITCPIVWKNSHPNNSGKKKEFILNPSGKSYLCILHEYMQRTLKMQPTYVFKELENPKTPYGATVKINNIEYGTGLASSKKMAKQEAAKETLKILIPGLCSKISDQELKNTVTDLSFFDEIQVEDPRVNDLGNKVGQPSPFQLLRECLRRNFGMGTPQCTINTTALKNQKCEFSLSVGKHSATIVAKNKRDGKQLAAQAILAKLHPHVPSWGSLLRLYATNVEKPMEKVEEMNEIKTHVPNKAVLENLRKEMRKLHKQKEAIQSKGKMLISTKDLPSKMSCVDL